MYTQFLMFYAHFPVKVGTDERILHLGVNWISFEEHAPCFFLMSWTQLRINEKIFRKSCDCEHREPIILEELLSYRMLGYSLSKSELSDLCGASYDFFPLEYLKTQKPSIGFNNNFLSFYPDSFFVRWTVGARTIEADRILSDAKKWLSSHRFVAGGLRSKLAVLEACQVACRRDLWAARCVEGRVLSWGLTAGREASTFASDWGCCSLPFFLLFFTAARERAWRTGWYWWNSIPLGWRRITWFGRKWKKKVILKIFWSCLCFDCLKYLAQSLIHMTLQTEEDIPWLELSPSPLWCWFG